MLYEFCKIYRCYKYAYVEANSDEEAIEKANRRDTQYEDNGDRDLDRLIEEQKERMRELDRLMTKYAEDNRHYEQEMKNINCNSDNINEYNDEQKQELYKKCIKSVYVEHDGITNHGRIIEINMIDGVKHTIHMTKRGNYFNTFIVTNKGEKKFDFEIEKRFERKCTKEK